jgi:S1-C subfamily serine protease
MDNEIEMKNKYKKYKSKYILLKQQGNNKYEVINCNNIKEINNNDENYEHNWVNISNLVRESIVQIFAISYTIDPMKPYISPSDKLARGSGFIIYNNNRIIIMTNAHVIEDAKNINVRTEQTKNIDLRANVINICVAKDLALIEINKDDIKYFDKIPNKLEFEDDRIFDDTTEVLVGGYPLGMENIKFTTGVLSGNQEEYDLEYDRKISYLQISAAVNPGNSGGPLFNKNSKIIGINSAGYNGIVAQNVSFAIPSHIAASVIYDLLHNNDNNKILDIPNYRFKWNNSNIRLFENLDIREKNISGVYIYDISKHSFLNLKKNDILFKIVMSDICALDEIWNINYLLNLNNINTLYEKNKKVEIIIDNFGIITMYEILSNESEFFLEKKKQHTWTLNRKVSLDEFLDCIPNNIELELYVIRNSKLINYKCTSVIGKKIGIGPIVPIYKPLDWEICLGCCFTPLNTPLITLNLKNDNYLLSRFLLDKYREKNWIAITNIFPDTDAFNTHIIEYGSIDIIKKINNISINTMKELREILNKFKNKYYSIEFEDGKKMILSDINGSSRKIDKYIYNKYNIILPTDFSKKWIA